MKTLNPLSILHRQTRGDWGIRKSIYNAQKFAPRFKTVNFTTGVLRLGRRAPVLIGEIVYGN